LDPGADLAKLLLMGFRGFLMVWCFMPLAALAFPALGDHVEFEARHPDGVIRLEKSVKAHDVDRDVFTVRTLIRQGERVIEDSRVELPRSFLYTPEKVANLLKTCVEREGALGTERIGGREVRVCEFYHEDSGLTTILGAVPFGQIRFQVYVGEGEFLDFWLKRWL
jgi:hypothetical protein